MRKSYKHYSLEKRNKTKTHALSYRKYHYVPLPSSNNTTNTNTNASTTIRLLRLHPSPDPSFPLRCTLFHAPLSSAPPYTALSYAWGDKTGSQFVNVDQGHVFVTLNLKHALLRLRGREMGEEKVLWVDAICIDQENIPERNFQTGNMRLIYQHAARVAVWLGLEYRGSGGAIRLVKDLNTCGDDRERIVGILNEEGREEDLRSLKSLFRRTYWWRIWVIQEVCSAREAVVYCGEEEIGWGDFDRVCDVFKEVEKELAELFYKHPSWVRTLTHGGPRGLQLSRFSPHLDAPPLFELLLSHKGKLSTEPKDKVYALVGVSSSSGIFEKIDYSLSEREIFTHTARHIIMCSNKLDIICTKQHDENQYDLPSWVPDWTRPPSIQGSLVVGLHHHEPEFKAAGNTLADFQFSSDGYILRASGVMIDTIKTLGMPYRKNGAPSDVGPALEAFHDWWNVFVTEHTNSIPSQAVFGRMISCGNWNFEDEGTYASKLETIFTLSDEVLAGSDVLILDPPSRSSTMISSVASLIDEEELIGADDGERTQLPTMLNAGLTMNRRSLFLTNEGLAGLAPWDALRGDVICVLLGCRFPVVMRPFESHYVLIGEAYVDGFMNGEAMVGLQDGKYPLDTFEIH